jgi:hypothetical protein
VAKSCAFILLHHGLEPQYGVWCKASVYKGVELRQLSSAALGMLCFHLHLCHLT